VSANRDDPCLSAIKNDPRSEAEMRADYAAKLWLLTRPVPRLFSPGWFRQPLEPGAPVVLHIPNRLHGATINAEGDAI
jgi:hypothetical protein